MNLHDEWGCSTRAVHSGPGRDRETGSLARPIYQTSTYAFEDAGELARVASGEREGFFYTRYGHNPNQIAVAQKAAALEGGEDALTFASGMAAITSSLLTALQAGDRVVAFRRLYSGTFAFFYEVAPRYGVDVVFVEDLETLRGAVDGRTRVVYVETPTNPTLDVVDIAAVVSIAQAHGAMAFVDNTFATPYNQFPLSLGADVVLHSATKYFGGHSDLVGGVVVGSKTFVDRLRVTLRILGGAMDPFCAWLVERGMKTFALRMERHNQNGKRVADFLSGHPKVVRVHYPGLRSHPDHDLVQRQMRGFGGMLSFEVNGGLEAGKRLVNGVRLCTQGVSLGGVETLIVHPASTTHVIVPREEREKAGVTDGLVRLSVGIEDGEDVIRDLDQALEQV